MTDREQTRRDAEQLRNYARNNPKTRDKAWDWTINRAADTIDDLLAELEQAKLDRDEWRASERRVLAELEQAERELRKVSSEADGWSIRAAYAEARLAKVPALVEALRGMVEPDPHTDGYANLEAAHAALADWDEKR